MNQCRGGIDDFDVECMEPATHPHIDESNRLHFYCRRHYRQVRAETAIVIALAEATKEMWREQYGPSEGAA